MHDLVIRNARLLDGGGGPPVATDVAVAGGRITAIGTALGAARRTHDAAGLALMPGIVDLHTHFDAQVTWDPTLSPSPSLGVTTAVLGNCGFGIAPCAPALRETLLRDLAVVEGMDLDALRLGTRWDFESFADYLAMLRDARPLANVAVFAQHSTIRTQVLGEAAATQVDLAPAELARMRALVRDALDAGAIGFASSWSPNHSGWAGRPMPSTIASRAEVEALVGVLGEAARGVFMMATGPRMTPADLEALVRTTGRPAFLSTVLTMHTADAPERGLGYYARCAEAIARGHEVYVQCSCQPLSFDFTLRDPYLLYGHPAFARVKAASPETLPAIYADPAFRAAFRADLAQPAAGVLFTGDWTRIEVACGATDATRALEGRSIAQIAADTGRAPLDAFLDLARDGALDTVLVAKLFNADDDGVQPLVTHPAGVITLSDAGAHLKFMCDAGFGLHYLGHWVRERGALSLGAGVRRLTAEPAGRYRIPDRGRIAPGAWADLVLFDPDTVGIGPPERVRDLPGGGARMIRRPRGVQGVWVNGERVFDGNGYVESGPRPGRVLDTFDR